MSRWLIVCSMAAIILLFAAIDPIAQDPAYHDFADDRRILGVSNFWNVVSNLPFLAVGLSGIGLVVTRPAVVGAPELRTACLVFFSGVTLTAFGSGYFHLAPSNATLVWDRLAMTVGFAGFIAIVLGEYVSRRVGARILVPLLLAGILSVIYWSVTESRGHGDLRPYVIVQFLPLLLIPVILVLRGRQSDLTPAIWLALVLYGGAKILEHFDELMYATSGMLSGHTLKHVAASMAPLVLIRALWKRRGEPGP